VLLIAITYHVDNVWFKFQSSRLSPDMVFFRGSSPVVYFKSRAKEEEEAKQMFPASEEESQQVSGPKGKNV